MAQIPYHNDSDKIVHVGGKSIAPGETRSVDETLLGRPKTADFKDLDEDLSDDGLTALLAKPVKEITAELEQLDDKQLDELEHREEASGSPRKSLIHAIQQESMARAASKMTGDKDEGDTDKLADETGGDDD